MNTIRDAFGNNEETISLYDVLGLEQEEDAKDPAKLRKAYFRKALVYHPDKTKEADKESAKRKFQAISLAYQVLQDPDRRSLYEETGTIGEEDNDDDDENGGAGRWKEYFDRIFGKVTTSKIDQFALKYKCSEEEQEDVLKQYIRWEGNLVKMMEYVLLSEPLDARRWIEDYINPAVEKGEVPDHHDTIHRTRKILEKKIKKSIKKPQASSPKKRKTEQSQPKSNKTRPRTQTQSDATIPDDDGNDDEHGDTTETEDSDGYEDLDGENPNVNNKQSKGKSTNKKVVAKKAKSTKKKVSQRRGDDDDNDDLVAMIQRNQKSRASGGGAELFASLGARYGVDTEDDPLGDDKEFERIQASLKKKKKQTTSTKSRGQRTNRKNSR